MTGCCNFMVDSRSSSNSKVGANLSGDDNLVSGSTVINNGGDGIDLSSDTNQITNTQSLNNGGVGASVDCPGAIVGLKTKNNTGGTLTTSGGTCTQINNKLL